jgi:serine/threonine protein kinase
MPLEPGLQLGPYVITGLIGAGGMGEVYRGRDTRLGRTVAIKVLSAEIADKPALRERFEREAQSISTLNHPAICTLYDVGRHEGLDYLVMEFLQGETLADRLARGPIPLKEALTIAAEIGEGLEVAHRHGIVHRDLKPANVMLVTDGARSAVQPKLLDFGLAKRRGVSDSTPVVVSAARTDVGNFTTVGTVLGTLQYMSPEQLQGAEADGRSDIFALGTVLHEMLTGRKAFEGKSQVSLMAAILEHDPPPVSSLQPVSPRALDHVVRGCLAKDPGERWQSVADVVKQVKWIAEESAKPPEAAPVRSGGRRERVIVSAGLVALAVAVGALVSRLLISPPPPDLLIRFDIQPPSGAVFPGANFTPRMAVSPNGQFVAFTTNFQDGKPDHLWIRRLDSVRATALVTMAEGTREPVQQPFWSPDSRFIGFFVDGKLRKVSVPDGVVQTLCSVPGNQYAGTWNEDGTILFGSSETNGLRRVSASGGVPSQVTTLDASSGDFQHLWPRFLPDGRHFLYQVRRQSLDQHEIYVSSLDDTSRVSLLKSAYMADFAPPDRVLFVNEGALLTQRFDASTLQLREEPVVVAEGVQTTPNGRAGFSVSANGVLVYRATEGVSAADSQLAWLDRSGKDISRVGSAASIRGFELSPAGDRAVFHVEERPGSGDLWIADIERGSRSRLTFDPARHNSAPVWSPDGNRIIFTKSAPSWALYEKNSNGVGDERLLYESKTPITPWSVSQDGKTLVLSESAPATGADLMTMPLAGGSAPSIFIKAPAQQTFGHLSPDGNWLAYTSTESGTAEVYVQSFPTPGTRYQVSKDGGFQPRWRGDGRELFFRQVETGGPISISAATVEPAGSGLRIGAPTRLFDVQVSTTLHTTPMVTYAVTSDGQRFLVARAQGETTTPFELPLTVVVNWDGALKR